MQTSGLNSQQFSNRMRVFRGTSKSLSGLAIVDWWMRTRPAISAIRKNSQRYRKEISREKYEVEEHLIPPEPVLVDASEAVDDDGDRQSEDENLK